MMNQWSSLLSVFSQMKDATKAIVILIAFIAIVITALYYSVKRIDGYEIQRDTDYHAMKDSLQVLRDRYVALEIYVFNINDKCEREKESMKDTIQNMKNILIDYKSEIEINKQQIRILNTMLSIRKPAL
jgi:hypothetical protein